MDPFLAYINFCYNMRHIADNQCYLHPQCTVDALLAWYQASYWGEKEKKKRRPRFLPFSPLRSLVQGYRPFCVELCSVELLSSVLVKPGLEVKFCNETV